MKPSWTPRGQETTNEREDENEGVELVNLQLSPPPAQIPDGIIQKCLGEQ